MALTAQEMLGEVGKELLDLMFAALEHGISVVSNQESGPLIPFMMTYDTAGDSKIAAFVTDNSEESLEAAKKEAAQLPASCQAYAIGFDGYVNFEDAQYDAIIVEGAERGKDYGLSFAQRYQPATEKRPLEKIGRRAFYGATEQLLLS